MSLPTMTKMKARKLAVTANDISVLHADPRMLAITVNLTRLTHPKRQLPVSGGAMRALSSVDSQMMLFYGSGSMHTSSCQR